MVFIPPDCIIPDNIINKNKLEYLRKDGRTKTIRLRGCTSQGLVLRAENKNWKEGDNVAEKLGIVKYEAPEPKYALSQNNVATKKRINPYFSKYTHIENIENFGGIFTEEDEIVITEKIHGTNARYGLLKIEIGKNIPLLDKVSMFLRKYLLGKKYEFVYGSHNVQITKHSNRGNFYGEDKWGEIAKRYDLANILFEDMIIYG